MGKSKAWLLDGLISGSKELITNRTASHILSSAFHLNFLPSRIDSPQGVVSGLVPKLATRPFLRAAILACLSRSEFPKLSCP